MQKWNPAVLAINGYQRYVSPYKGFCCAHRVLTGEPSCSEYAKQQIIKKGFLSALSAIKERFRDCKQSARHLNEQKESEANEGENAKKKNGACTYADALACAPVSCGDFSVGSTTAAVTGGCDGCACTPF